MSGSSDDDVFDLGVGGAAPRSIHDIVDADDFNTSSNDSVSMDDEVAVVDGPRKRGRVPKAKNKGKAAREKKLAAAKRRSERSVFIDDSTDEDAVSDDDNFIDDSDAPLRQSPCKRKSGGTSGSSGTKRGRCEGVEGDGEVVEVEVVDLDALSDEDPKKRRKARRKQARKRVEQSGQSEEEMPPETTEEARLRISLEDARRVAGDFAEDSTVKAAQAEEAQRYEEEMKRQREREARQVALSEARGREAIRNAVVNSDKMDVRVFCKAARGTMKVLMRQDMSLRKLFEPACDKFKSAYTHAYLLWNGRSLPLSIPLNILGLPPGSSIELRKFEQPVVGLKVRDRDGEILVARGCVGMGESIVGIRYVVSRKMGIDIESKVVLQVDGEDIGEGDTPESLDLDDDTLIEAKISN